MILRPLYTVFEKMVAKGGLLKWIAYPLGYCIYCSTTWIAIIGYFMVFKSISINILVPIAISHFIVDMYCKYVLRDILRNQYGTLKSLAKKEKFASGGVLIPGKEHGEVNIRKDPRIPNPIKDMCAPNGG